MITPFLGEFLIHPIPFEMSMEACSHSCVYCFANVRENKQRFEIKRFISQMTSGRENWVIEKINEGYPVCLSNNTDPFSKNNEKYTESVLEYMKAKNIRVFFQTKLGDRAVEMIKGYGIKSVVYVTITTPRDDVSKRIEPNAPASSERIEMIRQLRQMGHEIIVGINPLNPQWCSKEELLSMLEILKQIGVYSYVLAPLYIRKKRIPKYMNRDFAGVDLTTEQEFKDLPFFFDTVRTIDALGYKNVTHRHPFNTTAFDICKEVYDGKTLPTINDFLNYKDSFSFEEWQDWFIKSFTPFFTNKKGAIGPHLLSYLYICNKATYKRFAKENPRDINRASRWFFELVVKKMPQVKEDGSMYKIIKV